MTTYGDLADAGTPLTEIFALVMDLHLALKEAPVKGRVWTYAWSHDGRAFTLRLNGRLGQTVNGLLPLHVAIERDGWPVAVSDPFSGTLLGAGEPEVVAALRAALAAAKGGTLKGPEKRFL